MKFPLFLGGSAKELVKSKLSDSSDVSLEKIDNKKYFVYIDKDGVKHKVCKNCPHLKCELIFNKVEEIWECPCHGSKFDIDGKCIEGPSNLDVTFF